MRGSSSKLSEYQDDDASCFAYVANARERFFICAIAWSGGAGHAFKENRNTFERPEDFKTCGRLEAVAWVMLLTKSAGFGFINYCGAQLFSERFLN